MDNEKCLEILKAIDDKNGQITRNELYDLYPENKFQIVSLCTGYKPNIYLENNTYYLTQKGLMVLQEKSIKTKCKINNLPDYNKKQTVTDNNDNTIQNLITFEIDRNDFVKIKVKIHPVFSQWLKSNGLVKNFSQEYDELTVNNWDANNETKFVEIQLKGIDENWRDNTKIVCDTAPFGINPLIIKLAVENNNEYTVKYKGLISYENLKLFSDDLGNKLKHFYLNFVKPCQIKISLQFII